MNRGFKEVAEEHKQYAQKVEAFGKQQVLYPETVLPKRSDPRSAGYDFYAPVEFQVAPNSKFTLWTNVKAYMNPDEVLLLFVRSSIGIKQDIVLANGTGIIDASYFENPDNDGNIGICLRNTTGVTKVFQAGERIAQGIFMPYLLADEDLVLSGSRKGGTGSSGK